MCTNVRRMNICMLVCIGRAGPAPRPPGDHPALSPGPVPAQVQRRRLLKKLLKQICDSTSGTSTVGGGACARRQKAPRARLGGRRGFAAKAERTHRKRTAVTSAVTSKTDGRYTENGRSLHRKRMAVTPKTDGRYIENENGRPFSVLFVIRRPFPCSQPPPLTIPTCWTLRPQPVLPPAARPAREQRRTRSRRRRRLLPSAHIPRLRRRRRRRRRPAGAAGAGGGRDCRPAAVRRRAGGGRDQGDGRGAGP